MEESKCQFLHVVQAGLIADHASTYRSDDKTAEEYKLEGGATLHLVLALRGGC